MADATQLNVKLLGEFMASLTPFCARTYQYGSLLRADLLMRCSDALLAMECQRSARRDLAWWSGRRFLEGELGNEVLELLSLIA
jgi:hypothetical protein